MNLVTGVVGRTIGTVGGLIVDVVAMNLAAAIVSALAGIGGTMTGGLVFLVAAPLVLGSGYSGVFKLISRL